MGAIEEALKPAASHKGGRAAGAAPLSARATRVIAISP